MVNKFSRLSYTEQDSVLKAVYGFNEYDDLGIADVIKSNLKGTDSCSEMNVLTNEVELLEYRYTENTTDKKVNSIKHLRTLLFEDGILLAKIPGKHSTYRRYSKDKKFIDTVKVQMVTVKGLITYCPAMVLGVNIPVYYVCDCVDNDGKHLGYMIYYIDDLYKSSDKFTYKNGKLYLLSVRADYLESLDSGFKDSINYV